MLTAKVEFASNHADNAYQAGEPMSGREIIYAFRSEDHGAPIISGSLVLTLDDGRKIIVRIPNCDEVEFEISISGGPVA